MVPISFGGSYGVVGEGKGGVVVPAHAESRSSPSEPEVVVRAKATIAAEEERVKRRPTVSRLEKKLEGIERRLRANEE